MDDLSWAIRICVVNISQSWTRKCRFREISRSVWMLALGTCLWIYISEVKNQSSKVLWHALPKVLTCAKTTLVKHYGPKLAEYFHFVENGVPCHYTYTYAPRLTCHRTVWNVCLEQTHINNELFCLSITPCARVCHNAVIICLWLDHLFGFRKIQGILYSTNAKYVFSGIRTFAPIKQQYFGYRSALPGFLARLLEKHGHRAL